MNAMPSKSMNIIGSLSGYQAPCCLWRRLTWWRFVCTRSLHPLLVLAGSVTHRTHSSPASCDLVRAAIDTNSSPNQLPTLAACTKYYTNIKGWTNTVSFPRPGPLVWEWRGAGVCSVLCSYTMFVYAEIWLMLMFMLKCYERKTPFHGWNVVSRSEFKRHSSFSVLCTVVNHS
jgi:hypothetical protein